MSWSLVRKVRDGLLRARKWGKRRGYWPPKFRVLLPGDKGDAEDAISGHLSGEDESGQARDRRGPG